ncbi:MAG: hypothetical protein DKM24_07430 [Candidatus Melainabacteria bacterium]|nr:MAG: hypothetical protein DKM24_07430 [Candidatus Melainabacteria bacterium]
MKKIALLVCLLLLGSSVLASPVSIKENKGIYHITLSGNAVKKRINFIATDSLMTNKEVHDASKSLLTINTGFFDPKNGKTISYIVTDGQTVADPLMNDSLMLNPLLRLHMKKILNRSEFRIVECNKKLRYEIVPHNTPVNFMCSVKTSAQGGPQLLPELRLEEEFFILKNEEGNIIRQSASMLDRVPRTIVGIKNNEMHILIITNKNPKNIFEARDLCKSYGFEKAMAFDGGSSTSLDYKKIHVTSIEANDTGRSLKSFMIVK